MNDEICEQEIPFGQEESPSFSQEANKDKEIKINEKSVAFLVYGATGKDNLKNLDDEESYFFRDLPGFVLPDEAFEGDPIVRTWDNKAVAPRCAVDYHRVWRDDKSCALIYSGDEKYIGIIEREIYKRFPRVVTFTSHSVHKMEEITRDEIIRSLEERTRDKVEKIVFHGTKVVEIFFKSGREETLDNTLFTFLCGFKSLVMLLKNDDDEYGEKAKAKNTGKWPFKSTFVIR